MKTMIVVALCLSLASFTEKEVLCEKNLVVATCPTIMNTGGLCLAGGGNARNTATFSSSFTASDGLLNSVTWTVHGTTGGVSMSTSDNGRTITFGGLEPGRSIGLTASFYTSCGVRSSGAMGIYYSATPTPPCGAW